MKLKEGSANEPGTPESYLEFKKKIPELRKRAANDEPLSPILDAFDINPLPLQTSVQMQLLVIKKALQLIGSKK